MVVVVVVVVVVVCVSRQRGFELRRDERERFVLDFERLVELDRVRDKVGVELEELVIEHLRHGQPRRSANGGQPTVRQ